MALQDISTERRLTEAELAKRGKEQARLLAEIESLEAQKKQAADDFKARIGDLEKRVNEITFEINSGVVQGGLFANDPYEDSNGPTDE
jgi:hypothetical protein